MFLVVTPTNILLIAIPTNLEPNVDEAFSMLVIKANTVASACAGVTLANKI